MKNILVPLDGTALSRWALPYAEALARRADAALTLVRDAQTSFSLVGDPAIDAQREIMLAEDYLEQIRRDVETRGVCVQTGVPFDGSAAWWIAQEVFIRHADLIVMATHDRSGMDRLLHGSVAEGVVGRAAVPVMLVRQPVDTPFADEHPTVVVPLDGSELADRAIPVAREFATALNGRLVLLGVAKPGALLVDTRTMLEDRAARPELAHVAVEVRQGTPAREILAAVDEHAATVVVMATHGRTGLLRSVMGSVAGEVLHGAAVPVALVPPERARTVRAEVDVTTATATA